MQFQYSSGAGNHSLEESLNACKSYDVKSSAIHVLVSELRLRTLMDRLDTITSTFNKTVATEEVTIGKLSEACYSQALSLED